MVKRHKAGLPPGMDLGISLGGDDDGPADLGHYLSSPVRAERGEEAPAQAKRNGNTATAEKVVEIERPRRPEPVPAARSPAPKGRPKASASTQPRKRPMRMEIGCDAATKQKIKRIAGTLRDAGPQEDASASEFLQAAALLIERVHHLGQYSRLRPRGHWGTDTARDFIETLADIYFDALGDLYVEERWEEIRARVEREQAREREGNA